MTDVAFVLGTRPEIIKLAPVIRACQRSDVAFSMIHTGQHYSDSLDSVFFDQLELPTPDYDLGVGSSSHGRQTGEMLIGVERCLTETDPDVVLVQGDTNSVLAGALAASKADAALGHVEAGLRSGDRSMPEEINRIVADHGRIDHLLNIAGTWRGGDPVEETEVDQFDMLFDVNLTTMFLASKHALPHLQDAEAAVVSVSARSALEGGAGDGVYRSTKAGVRIMTETIAEENLGTVRANCVLPSVLDTPMNRDMMTPSDEWVEPAEVAEVMQFLCSDAAAVTSGAAVPVYGEA